MALFASAVSICCLVWISLMMTDRSELNLEIGMAMGVLLVVISYLALVFDAIIDLNRVLSEETVGVLLNWKDLFERAYWHVGFVVEKRETKQIIREYFDHLKFEL